MIQYSHRILMLNIRTYIVIVIKKMSGQFNNHSYFVSFPK